MNLVAHQLLSFNNPDWQVGNHLGEVIRAKRYAHYPASVQKGILLHRLIDTYTDQHEVVKHSSTLLHTDYGKYSPVIVDIFYDYILIKHWDIFCDIPFEKFKNDCYLLFEKRMDEFTPKLKKFTQAIIKYDWFAAYGTLDGIEKTLKAMSARTKFENNMYMAVKDLYKNGTAFKTDFFKFFPDLERECSNFLGITS